MDAGVSTSLVHYHFDTRDALLEEALEYSYELAGDIRLGPEGDVDEFGSVRRLAAMIDQFLPYPGLLERDWILYVELWLRAVRHPEMRADRRAPLRAHAGMVRRGDHGPASSAASSRRRPTPTASPTASSRSPTATACGRCSATWRWRRRARRSGMA